VTGVTPAPRVARAQRGTATSRPRAQAVPASTPRPRAQAKAAPRPRTQRSTLATVADSPLTSYYLIAGVTTALLAIGLVMVLSSSAITEIADGNSPYTVFAQQAQFALIGVPLLLLAARLPIRVYKRLAWPALLLALALQALTLVPSLTLGAGGNNSWVYVGGGFSFQPAEVAKVALAIWLATVLGRKQRLLGSSWHALIPAVPGALAVIGLVLVGKDLGTALIVMLLVVGAMFVAGVPIRLLVIGAAGAGAIVVRFLVLGQGTHNRSDRILTAVQGCNAHNVLEGCYQVTQGMQALGTGGLAGVGLGASREKWSYLPEAHNDFIFAVIGEELGLFGTLLVLALVGVLGFACIRLVRRHKDPFAKVAAAAIGCWIVGQALINIGVVIKIIPVIGVPLPLVSAGGSALVTTLVAMGVLLALARTEPGAPEALAARPSVARRSLAVVSGARRRERRAAR
jgi:cell division protein FtsW